MFTPGPVCRFSDDFKAANKRTSKRLVRGEFVPRETCGMRDEVVCLYQNVAKIITRLEGHPGLRPEFAVR